MKKSALIKAVVAEIDVSRPVTMLFVGEEEGILDELLAAISPTSRVIVRGEGKDDDERVERMRGSMENPASFREDHRVAWFDAIIVNTKTFSLGEQKKMLEQGAQMLKPSGAFLIFPFSSELREAMRKNFSELHEFRVWRCLPPMRIAKGVR